MNKLLNFNFTNKDIINIINTNPYILLLSSENIGSQILSIKGLGFSLEDVVIMINNFPLLFGYDLMNIDKKNKFYRSIGLDQYMINHSKIFVYNLDLITARWNYLNTNNFGDNKVDLFLPETEFYKKYNIKSLDLIKE